jgi:dihydrofolate reductase
VLTASVEEPVRKSDNLLLWNPAHAAFASVADVYKNVAILGGAKTYSYFLQEHLLEELYLTVEPIVFGRGVSLFEYASGDPSRFELLSEEKLNERGSVLLHYRILN